MTQRETENMAHGLYFLHWKSVSVPSFDWETVLRAELLTTQEEELNKRDME